MSESSVAARPAPTGATTKAPVPTPRIPLRARLFGIGGLTFPAWAYLLFFFVIPMALVVWYSFGYKPDLFTTYATDRLSLDRYGEALESQYRATFFNTVQVAVIGTALALLVAVPFTYWVAVKAKPSRRPLILALVLIPFWTNFLVRTVGWQVTLAPEGWLSALFTQLGLPPLSILYTRGAVQIGVVYNYLPLMILPLYVAMDRAGKSLREASRDLGAGRWTTFFRVTLPLAAPGIASGCLLVFIPLMGDYVTPQVLGGAKGTMVGQMIAAQFEDAQNWALGSAMTVVLMIAILICVAIAAVIAFAVKTFLEKVVWAVPTPKVPVALTEMRRPKPTKSGGSGRDWTTIAFPIWGALVMLFLFLPILVMIAYSFNTGNVLAQFDSFGFSSFTSALQNNVITSSVRVSLTVALLSAILATVLGSLAGIAIGTSKRPTWWGIGLGGLLTVTLVTPDIADAIAFLPWFVRLGVDGGVEPFNIGLFRLVIAHTVISIVVVTFIVRARVSGMNASLMEAAGDLYASPLARLRHVILPVATPGIVAGGLLAFTFSLDDVVISSFVQQPGYTPWPVYIFSSVRVALKPEVAAMSTLMLLLTLAVLAVCGLILRKTGESTKSIVEMMGT